MYSLFVEYTYKGELKRVRHHGIADYKEALRRGRDLVVKDPEVIKVVIMKRGFEIGWDGEREKCFDEICVLTHHSH